MSYCRQWAIEIGFNSRYLLDITEQIEGEGAKFILADAASPTIVRDATDGSARALRAHADACLNDRTVRQNTVIPFALPSKPSLAAAPPARAVARLVLTDFRGYARQRLSLAASSRCLYGLNGGRRRPICSRRSPFLARRARVCAASSSPRSTGAPCLMPRRLVGRSLRPTG